MSVLALTDHATQAIEGILRAPATPDGAGVRISATAGPNAAGPEPSALAITVAPGPAETDQVIDEEGARVFVEAPVAEYLDDKLLDARIVDEEVSFTIGEQEQ
jgi:iron-sulfur cluster assembly protein